MAWLEVSVILVIFLGSSCTFQVARKRCIPADPRDFSGPIEVDLLQNTYLRNSGPRAQVYHTRDPSTVGS